MQGVTLSQSYLVFRIITNLHSSSSTCLAQLLRHFFAFISVESHRINLLSVLGLALWYRPIHAKHCWSRFWVGRPDRPAHCERGRVEVLRINAFVLEALTGTRKHIGGTFAVRPDPPLTDCDVLVISVWPVGYGRIYQYVSRVEDNVIHDL